MSILISGCNKSDSGVTSSPEGIRCLIGNADWNFPSDKGVAETDEPKDPCRTTAEAHRYFLFCEAELTMDQNGSCADLHNPDSNRIPSTLGDAIDARTALDADYRRDCGREPTSIETLLPILESCSK